LGGGGLGDAGLGRSFDTGGLGSGGFDRFSGGGLGGGSFAAPNRTQLNSFLGLPSDEGLHSLSAAGANGFNVQHGVVEGPRGGYAAGAAVEGPRGNEAARGVAVGPDGGVAAGRAVSGAGGATAAQGIAMGPGGRVAAGGAVTGPYGGGAARGVVAGPRGAAAGFAAWSPSNRYVAAAGVRTNFNHYDMYGAGWYTAHPGAWYAAGWRAGSAWTFATWPMLDAWFAYPVAPAPIYYDYGNNVTYQNDNVYINGQDVGTGTQYYDQAAALATSGTQADAPSDGDWLPLGVFALTQSGQTSSNLVLQLAINKQGILRGNYTDNQTHQTLPVHGSLDKQTQRVALTVGDNQSTVIETGLYNLTKDEAPALMHFGNQRTEQWLLVRLKNPNATAARPRSDGLRASIR